MSKELAAAKLRPHSGCHRLRVARCLAVIASAAGAPIALAQQGPASAAPAPPVALTEDSPYEGRPIAEIVFEGLRDTPRQFVENNIRSAVGRPLSWEIVREDLQTLNRTGRFDGVEARLTINPDASVNLIYALDEATRITAVDVVGNRAIDDEQIRRVVAEQVALIEGTALDEYRINQARQAIADLYRAEGFYQAEVTLDEEEREIDNTILFRVREGPRTQVTGIRFRGNEAFESKLLRPRITSKTKFLFVEAPLNQDTLEADVAALVRYYRDQGYLDVRADREITFSPNGREAIVTFLIEEGPQYTLRTVSALNSAGEDVPLEVFTIEQIRGLINLKPGDAYASSDVRDAVNAVRDAYRQMGYVDARVARSDFRAIDSPRVDMQLVITEGERWRTGLVRVSGNTLTQAKVVRRRVELRPPRWLDGKAVEISEQRLAQSRLFELNPALGDPPSITIQPPDPANPGHRDVLVEVQETNTGSLSFGAAVDSDAGVIGAIRLNQRNFDVADTPDSFGELFTGRAFRGAGQTFDLALQPGTEVSTYSISLTEPNVLETDWSFTSTAFFRDREFREFDEQRFGGRFRLARRFGTRWIGGLSLRAESIDLGGIDRDSPVDVFEVADQNILTSVGFDLTRTTVDNRFRPTRGTRTELGVERVGLLGGDFDFTRLTAEHNVFLTIDRDEFDRATVLGIKLRGGYIPEEDESPVYERFYLGGRSFRGFDFRGIGPVGIRNDTGRPGDDQVGGDFLFFAGVDIEKPIFQDIVAVVVFLDSGTISEDVSLDNYRVSVGAGLRLYLPQFGQAPLAFDFGFPLRSEDTDEEELFSFSIDLPF